jgi:hypothetical protein
VLDATSELRGDLIEDAVEALFEEHGILYIRTGSHNQAEIAARFEVTVQPAPDFVVYDQADSPRAILECKGANDGGTARDKALRFDRLHVESRRLGIPLVAVLGGLGWTRVNDTLGPVVRDCDGRVFSVSNLDEMLTVAPFSSLSRLEAGQALSAPRFSRSLPRRGAGPQARPVAAAATRQSLRRTGLRPLGPPHPAVGVMPEGPGVAAELVGKPGQARWFLHAQSVRGTTESRENPVETRTSQCARPPGAGPPRRRRAARYTGLPLRARPIASAAPAASLISL